MKPTPGSSSSNSSGSSETKYTESPDDLFKIGISDVDYTSWVFSTSLWPRSLLVLLVQPFLIALVLVS
ncbi:hypothetical protein ACOMHN_009443 [Nucella lapillus]